MTPRANSGSKKRGERCGLKRRAAQVVWSKQVKVDLLVIAGGKSITSSAGVTLYRLCNSTVRERVNEDAVAGEER